MTDDIPIDAGETKRLVSENDRDAQYSLTMLSGSSIHLDPDQSDVASTPEEIVEEDDRIKFDACDSIYAYNPGNRRATVRLTPSRLNVTYQNPRAVHSPQDRATSADDYETEQKFYSVGTLSFERKTYFTNDTDELQYVHVTTVGPDGSDLSDRVVRNGRIQTEIRDPNTSTIIHRMIGVMESHPVHSDPPLPVRPGEEVAVGVSNQDSADVISLSIAVTIRT